MPKTKKRPPVTKVQVAIRSLAASWPKNDLNTIDLMATAIESAIPQDCKNEDAIKALECARRAREFGISEKGTLFIAEAQASYKDFMLWEPAMRDKKFTQGRKKDALGKSTLYIYELSKNNPDIGAKELFRKADRSVIGDMALGTFKNHVSKGRK